MQFEPVGDLRIDTRIDVPIKEGNLASEQLLEFFQEIAHVRKWKGHDYCES